MPTENELIFCFPQFITDFYLGGGKKTENDVNEKINSFTNNELLLSLAFYNQHREKYLKLLN